MARSLKSERKTWRAAAAGGPTPRAAPVLGTTARKLARKLLISRRFCASPIPVINDGAPLKLDTKTGKRVKLDVLSPSSMTGPR